MKQSFFEKYGDWNVQPYCDKHKHEWVDSKVDNTMWVQPECCYLAEVFDGKSLGKFNIEAYFDRLIVLNSKTYYGTNKHGGVKYSSKGLSKHQNDLTWKSYYDVLFSQQKGGGENIGFRSTLQGGVFTYRQHKSGLSFFTQKD